MATYTATIKFADIRVITIEADTLEEATAKYDAGDWADETTIDFHALSEIKPLTPAEGSDHA